MEDASLLGLMGRLVFSLAIVLFLMFLLARVMRNRTMPGLGRGAVRRDLLQVLARQNLSKSTSVAVLQAADRALVVGVSDAGVTVLAEILPESLEPDEPELEPGGAPVGPTGPTFQTWQGFMDILRERSTRRG